MPAPLTLDTSRPDWRRQFRGISTCTGPNCTARIGWVLWTDEGGKERRVPYNDVDGRIHHSTCPDVEHFKRPRNSSNRPADASSTPPSPQAKPPARPGKPQLSLFGSDSNYPD
jgi:hypothetical protein